MRVLVTAPAGNVGRHVVRLLLAAGARPTLLVRDPARLDPAVREACDVRVGDLTAAAVVKEAAAGVDAAFWLDTTPHVTEDPIAESAALGEVFASAGVPRAVFVSSSGAELRGGAGHIDGLGAIEDALTGDVTVLRCGYFVTNLLMDLDPLREGTLATTRDPQAPLAWVAPRDIAEVAVGRLLSRNWSGRVVQGVHGPEDLSFAQVAGILSEVLGRTVTAVGISDDDVRAALGGLPPAAVEGIVGMTAGTRDLPPEPPRSPVTTTPTTLGEWAWAELRPLL
jgi:uncharacterized protein YbjT (DUF2867 family)